MWKTCNRNDILGLSKKKKKYVTENSILLNKLDFNYKFDDTS
jgi:hypothetical protein